MPQIKCHPVEWPWVSTCPNCGWHPEIRIRVMNAKGFVVGCEKMWKFHFLCCNPDCVKGIIFGDVVGIHKPFDEVVKQQIEMWNLGTKRYIRDRDKEKKNGK